MGQSCLTVGFSTCFINDFITFYFSSSSNPGLTEKIAKGGMLKHTLFNVAYA